jgi:prophage regulatory protein
MTTAAKKKPAAQAALARKAKKLKDETHESSAAAKVRAQLDSDSQKPSSEAVPLPARRRALIESARPPPKQRLLSRAEVMRLVPVSYPTLWAWMREGKFPRARAMNNGRIAWLESEIEAWITGLRVKPLKGDDEPTA